MEITYQIEPEDFVAFNLSYMNGSSVMRASIRNTRLICAGIVAVGGCLLMYMLHSLNAISAIAYIALAAVIYALMPRFMVSKVRKGVLRMLARPQNKDICSEKTFTLGETEMALCGGGEDSHYEYKVVERVTEDTEHYFIYVGAMAALIIPFRAFATGEEKAGFYNQLCERVQQGGGNISK